MSRPTNRREVVPSETGPYPGAGGFVAALSGVLVGAVVCVVAVLAAGLPPADAAEDGGGTTQQRMVDLSLSGERYASGELILSFEPSARLPASVSEVGLLSGRDIDLEQRMPDVNSMVVKLPADSSARLTERLRASLEQSPRVESADYNYLMRPTATPNDPRFDRQYGPRQVNAPRAWDVTRGKPSTKIAVIDTGISQRHRDLEGRIAGQRDFANDDGRAEESMGSNGHGTHVAGTASAATNNGRGVAGLGWRSQLLIGKVFGPRGASQSDVVRAINWATNKDAAAINLSLGASSGSEALQRSVQRARANGSLPVAAAGNEGINSRFYPAFYDETLAVAATARDDRRASYSQKGSWLDVSAPGTDVISTVPANGYGYKSGTSMAAPHVSGVAALMASQGRSDDRIAARIKNTATDRGPAGDDRLYGTGRLNAAAAVRR